MAEKINKSIDYIFVNKIKHLLRQGENTVSVINTKTPSPELEIRGEYVYYKFVATNLRLIILAKGEKFEHSESFGYNELKNTLLVRGLFFDKLKLYRKKYKLNKKNAKRFIKLADYMTIQLSTWKYYVYTFVFLLILALTYKAVDYFNIHRKAIFSSGEINKEQKAKPGKPAAKKQKPTKIELDKELFGILKGYDYAFKQIVKKYPDYFKKPVMNGEPFSRFDTWVTREIINTLDAQDDKLSSLDLSLEKHVMFKLGISKLRLQIMRYLDLCKKTFKQPKLRKNLAGLRNKINSRIEKLKKIIK